MKLVYLFLTSLLSLLIANKINGQIFSFSKEIKFVQYLIEKEQFDDAKQVLFSIDTLKLRRSEKDSLYYEIAWFSYNRKNLETAINYFNKITDKDSRYHKAAFFSAYCYTYLGKYKESEQKLIGINLYNDSILQELKSFQLAGVAILTKSFDKYTNYQKSFSYKNYAFNKEEANLEEYHSILKTRKKKSPIIAGLSSTILPGSGKWYAGKKKQAVAALLPILAAGFLTREAYKKEGVNSVRFWVYGAVFTTLYVGNIWGSTIAVKVANNEFNRKYEQKILFDMHIPLRNLFN